MSTLFKSVHLVDPQSKFHLKTVDVLVKNGTISSIEKEINESAEQVISIENLHLSRGWFDSSVCFGEPGYEERETLLHGLEVAAKSGFTSIALNSNTQPAIDNFTQVSFLKTKTKAHPVDLYPIGNLTFAGHGEHLAEIYDMSQAGAVAFGDYKTAIENPNLFKISLQYAQNFGALLLSFPQENKIAGKAQVHEGVESTTLGLKGIPALAEELQIARDLYLLEYSGGKLHIPTISTARSVELIKAAKQKGLDVTCSVAIHHLHFTDKELAKFDSNFKVLPPLRGEEDRKALIKGLKKGTIDMVTSDHCPIDIEHKNIEFENASYGSLGLESAFGILHRIFDLEDCVRLLTQGKKRFQVQDTPIEVGNMADFSLFIPKGTQILKREDLISTSKNSLFIGEETKGKVIGSFSKNTFIKA